jgi:hypothetical protein
LEELEELRDEVDRDDEGVEVPVLLPLGVEEMEAEPDLLCWCCRVSAVWRTFKGTRSKIMSFELKIKHIQNTAKQHPFRLFWYSLAKHSSILQNNHQSCTFYLTNTERNIETHNKIVIHTLTIFDER